MSLPQYIERVVNLLDDSHNCLYNMSLEEAQRRLLSGNPNAVNAIEGSYALLVKQGVTVKMARSLDRPVRYFLAKRKEGPALVVADRIDRLKEWLDQEGLGDQFHPSYTRMVPAHYIVELQLIGCPDPDPVYTRYFDPKHDTLPPDLTAIGKAYIGALADEIAKWFQHVSPTEPIGVAFSGGIDSGAVFLTTYHVMRKLGLSPSRLKAFTLTLGDGEDLDQAKSFLDSLQLNYFLEPIHAQPSDINIRETIQTVEDYKPLDLESAAMSLLLGKGIRKQYPEWKFLLDGEGGDENLKDYPIEENPELTIRSVLHNQMLYHEGWGVGKFKHSQTYSGGLSRSYTRTYATHQKLGFQGFSPLIRPSVIQISEGIPYIELTQYDVPKLYALKGEIVARGIQEITGMKMLVFPKRRFQHGAIPAQKLHQIMPHQESLYRREFLSLYQS